MKIDISDRIWWIDIIGRHENKFLFNSFIITQSITYECSLFIEAMGNPRPSTFINVDRSRNRWSVSLFIGIRARSTISAMMMMPPTDKPAIKEPGESCFIAADFSVPIQKIVHYALPRRKFIKFFYFSLFLYHTLHFLFTNNSRFLAHLSQFQRKFKQF